MIEINLTKLDRGTKTEWRTVTRGGKTFKQRFRVGEKDGTASITEYETKIKDMYYETCGAFDDTGNLIFKKDGEEDNVKFTPEEKAKFEGVRFTHNHPRGDSFSPADLQFACAAKMKEIRVICKLNNKTFSIQKKDGTNLDIDLWIDKLKSTVGKHNKEVFSKFNAQVYDGTLTIEDAENSHWQKVWNLVNDEVDEIIYKEV